ncbi:uncharacterized protein LOC115987341 [Quercus lobata]|uniref:Cardiolipin synthase N-terminal domain-containing protein n=1 Tax=Quercus lobata TaxID=97700 RepID=A0A7N2LJF9_QUELO|nr:uncharacterized protein LOC115987341 [Quercus lobata]
MFANANIISCNFSSFTSSTLNGPKLRTSLQSQNLKPRISFLKTTSKFSAFLKPHNHTSSILEFQRKGLVQICHGNLTNQNSEDPAVEKGDSLEGGVGGSGNGGEGWNWSTSILLLVLWGALMYYVFNLTPNQTPSRDMYFLQKLLNLKGDDGFRMNEVLVSLWYIMGLWPLVYSMLLLPTGRSSKSKIPVWPFLILSCFGGAYALLPYFVLWKPPPPPVEETEVRRWPLNFLESKLTAGISLAAGLGIIVYAGLANWDDWKEFAQYFRESKFIHITSLDFTLLSAFAPFWVYNDMTARKWFDKGSWLLPLSAVPFLGPALYLVLRPSLTTMPISLNPTTSKSE